MELELLRTYFPNGTNGVLRLAQDDRLSFICYTIELPWLGNKPRVSCIPEGGYEVVKRFSAHHGWHLQLKKVLERSLILLHPANDALKELKGCMAPVSILTAEGKGLQSRVAMESLKALVYPSLEKKEKVFLTIKSNQHETE